MSRLSCLTLLALLSFCLRGGAADATTAAWNQRLLQARQIIGICKQKTSFAPVVSKRVSKGEAALPIEAKVRGLPYVWLVVNDGGNSFNCDHAVWCDPVFVDAKGKKAPLTKLPALATKVGWFRFEPRKNQTVTGTRFKEALFAHAVSYACFAVPAGTERFEAFGGILDSSCGGRVTFEVCATVSPKIAAEAVWASLRQDFPEQCGWVEEDLPDGAHLNWLLDGSKENIQLIERNLATLGKGGAALRARADEFAKQKLSPADPKWLALYLEGRALVARVRHAQAEGEFVRKTLALVEKAAPRPAFQKEVAVLEGRIDQGRQNPDTDWEAEVAACKALRRRIILSHPALDFESLLINKRPPPSFHHQCDQYLGRHSRPGPGLVVLKDWKSGKPKETPLLLGKLPEGQVAHPDLSFDAKRIAFAFCDNTVADRNLRRFFIWEIGVDGSGLRQLTGTPSDELVGWQGRQTILIEDFDPCYLPDGGIAFISTRCQSVGRCHHRRYNPSYMLHRMNGDGSGIQQLSFGEANEWDPSVMHDGRILYTRWDYINRHDVYFQSLWTTRPDGTNTAHYYGNYSRNPCMTAEGRSIPGSRCAVSTAMAHHDYTHGSIIKIDPYVGQDGMEPITRLTPDVPFPETEGWSLPRTFCNPWPLNEDLYLVAYSPTPVTRGAGSKPNVYHIALLDSLGGVESIYEDPDISCFAPIPLVPRPTPPVLPSMLPSEPETNEGTVYIENVQVSNPPLPEGVRIHQIRVNSILGQPTPSVPHRGKVRQEIVKRIEGYASVDAEGMSSFKAPAGVPLQLQALDENGAAVMTMRSFVYLQPGETMSCVGCHEQRLSAPPRAGLNQAPAAVALRPPSGPRYPGGFSFVKSVQPVLDRHCISCHGLKEKPAGNLNLLASQATFPVDGYPGWPTEIHATTSYSNLVHRPGLVRIAQRNEETSSSKPDDYFARASKLLPLLLGGHCPSLKADPEGMQRIVEWLDLNTQYNGDYSWNRDEDRTAQPEGEKALRAFLAKRFGMEVAKQPFSALVNVGLPDQSRVLQAALPADAGGWAQLPKPFAGPTDAGYQQLRSLVVGAIAPSPSHDRAGTCNQPKCICGSCWVREAEEFWRKRERTLSSAK